MHKVYVYRGYWSRYDSFVVRLNDPITRPVTPEHRPHPRSRSSGRSEPVGSLLRLCGCRKLALVIWGLEVAVEEQRLIYSVPGVLVLVVWRAVLIVTERCNVHPQLLLSCGLVLPSRRRHRSAMGPPNVEKMYTVPTRSNDGHVNPDLNLTQSINSF